MTPDPTTRHPLPAHERVVFLKPLVSSPRIVVGEYTYYDDPDVPPAQSRLVGLARGPGHRARPHHHGRHPAEIARIAAEHGLEKTP